MAKNPHEQIKFHKNNVGEEVARENMHMFVCMCVYTQEMYVHKIYVHMYVCVCT